MSTDFDREYELDLRDGGEVTLPELAKTLECAFSNVKAVVKRHGFTLLKTRRTSQGARGRPARLYLLRSRAGR